MAVKMVKRLSVWLVLCACIQRESCWKRDIDKFSCLNMLQDDEGGEESEKEARIMCVWIQRENCWKRDIDKILVSEYASE